MKNNKGFSLVELIIVIAIMAILIGVMAPQLIKYIEKANVSADVQICDSIRTAITTTMMDPAVVTDPAYSDISSGTSAVSYTSISAACTAAVASSFTKNVQDLLGSTTPDSTLSGQLKSHCGNAVPNFVIYLDVNGSNVIVYVPKTDMSGAKHDNATPKTNKSTSAIYAGTLTTDL